MAARVTPAEFAEMHRLYAELGNAAEVARRINRSASTVRRYIKMQDCPALVRHTTKELIRPAKFCQEEKANIVSS